MKSYQFSKFYRIFHKLSLSGEWHRKQETDPGPRQIEAILAKAKFIRLALSDPENSSLYLVPLSFDYKDNAIYLHGSPKGKKIDIIRNNKVCFEADIETKVITADNPCTWSSITSW
ncbi:MAG: pyridoxamine 5'-phosphate oxidase family protein [Methanosarcina barkeri]|nr:pyridoxamine 5'-phosphate oxidase family protein [Methanosarcina sp. ERenArc_MAG2]